MLTTRKNIYLTLLCVATCIFLSIFEQQQNTIINIMEKGKSTQNTPYVMEVEAGKKAYCTCGLSSNQPFCDGQHKGSSFTPEIVEFDSTKKVAFCGCRKSGNGAFCDGSHAKG